MEATIQVHQYRAPGLPGVRGYESTRQRPAERKSKISEARRQYLREYYQRNKEKAREYQRRYNLTHKKKTRMGSTSEAVPRETYKSTFTPYDIMQSPAEKAFKILDGICKGERFLTT